MENDKLVSIIMPAYNASEYIQESINSVLAQTYKNWELIIVDDGSTDTTADIVKKNLLNEERIILLQQSNGKQGKAKNLGIGNAKGSYIAFLDSDDLWMPEKLECQLEEIYIQKADLVFSDSFVFYEDDVENKKLKMNTLHGIFSGKTGLLEFLKKNRIPNLTVLSKKAKILSVNAFSEDKDIQNAEDYHLWLKMLSNDSIFYGSREVLAAYRIHKKNTTINDPLAGKQKVGVFYDLMRNEDLELKQYFKKTLIKELKIQLNKPNYSYKDYNYLLEKTCQAFNKEYYFPFFKTINFLFGKNVSRKFINHILNARSKYYNTML